MNTQPTTIPAALAISTRATAPTRSNCFERRRPSEELLERPTVSISLRSKPRSVQAEAVSAKLLPAIHHPAGRRKKPSKEYVAAIGTIVADVLKGASYTPIQPCRRRMAGRDFTGAPIGREPFKRARDDLANHDFIEVYEGDRAFRDREGYVTRILPLPRLTDLCAAMGVRAADHRRHFDYGHKVDDIPPIRLRAASIRDGKWKARGRLMRVDYKDPRVVAEAARIRALNSFIETHAITGSKEFQPLEIALYRSFNQGDHTGHSYRLGGRIYDNGESYQQMKDKERSLIRINDEPVVEIDISACFLTIAYALTGTPLPSEDKPYHGPDLPRDITKAWVNMTLSHARFHSRWPKEVKEKLEKKGYTNLSKTHPIRSVEKEIRSKLPIMANWPDAPISWPEFFYEESEIMMEAMERLMVLGIVSLPIHDSLLIPRSRLEQGITAIKDSFFDRLGLIPNVEPKSLYVNPL